MSYNGDCKTAPSTPGLLSMSTTDILVSPVGLRQHWPGPPRTWEAGRRRGTGRWAAAGSPAPRTPRPQQPGVGG